MELVVNTNQWFVVWISLLYFRETERENWLESFFYDSIQNDSNYLIRESKIHNSKIHESQTICDDSNQDSSQFLNWFPTHESEIFDLQQAQLNDLGVFRHHPYLRQEKGSWAWPIKDLYKRFELQGHTM